MNDGRAPGRPPAAGTPPQTEADAPIAASEVASAGRSCLVILVLAVAVLLVLCVGIAVRWATLS